MICDYKISIVNYEVQKYSQTPYSNNNSALTANKFWKSIPRVSNEKL